MEKLDFLTEKENEVRNKFLEKFDPEKIYKTNDDEIAKKLYGAKKEDSLIYNIEFVVGDFFGRASGQRSSTCPIFLNDDGFWQKGQQPEIDESFVKEFSIKTKKSIEHIDSLIKNKDFMTLFSYLNENKEIFGKVIMHKYLCVVYPKYFLHWHIQEEFRKYKKILNLDGGNDFFVVEKYFWDKYKNNIEELNMKTVTNELEQKVKENESKERNNQNEEKDSTNGIQNNQPLNQILYGPPGTGKTYNTVIKAMEIIGTIKINYDKEHNVLNYEELQEEFNKLKQSKQIEFITFHQSYSYEEFIEGIKPVINKKDNDNNAIKYEYNDGIFKELCLRAEKDKGNNYVIIIDEINRGNISKIFGELITLIEEDKRIGNEHELKLTLPYSKESLGIPKNLYIIGTMNTSDRSIASVDIALRRRFKFIEMMPKENLITDIPLGKDKKTFIDIFKALNEKIIILLDRDHQIGHSYFMQNKIKSIEDLKNVWFNEILPLLNEYFYNDWEKLQALLGEASKNNDSFIVVKETKFPFYNYDNDIEDKVYYDFIDKKDMSNDDNFKSALLKIIEEPKQKEIDEK